MGVSDGFDPNAAAGAGAGIFGLPHGPDESLVIVLPVPYDATTSYGKGTADGPAAVVAASAQLDLHDHLFGDAWRAGVWVEPEPAEVRRLSDSVGAVCQRVFESGADAAGGDRRTIDSGGERVLELVRDWSRGVLAAGKVPCVLGGDHSTPLGSILACAEAAEGAGKALGVLQLDAHMDLRPAYCGMRFSHASVMHNALAMGDGVERLVQVGIRDYSGGERAAMLAAGGRVVTHFAEDLFAARDAGESWGSIAARILGELPEWVYVSFDIDAYEPHLCPNTGTPVPGGLSFHEARGLIAALARSGKRIVGFDVVEVTPSDHGPINEVVGMRTLASLCWAAARSSGGG